MKYGSCYCRCICNDESEYVRKAKRKEIKEGLKHNYKSNPVHFHIYRINTEGRFNCIICGYTFWRSSLMTIKYKFQIVDRGKIKKISQDEVD